MCSSQILSPATQPLRRKLKTLIPVLCRYVPKPGEWIHEFNWHGEDPTNKTRKIKGALVFKRLRIIADQMYYNIQEVRTKDDTMITVKVMTSFLVLGQLESLSETSRTVRGAALEY